MDIPETDGIVFVENTKNNLIGKFVNVKITGANEYDLTAKLVK